MRILFPIVAGFCCFAASHMLAIEPPTDNAGFISLFDGKSLAGWQGAINGYEAKDGVLKPKSGIGGSLYTKDEYGDFVFRFEFKLTPNANSGIGLRTLTRGDSAYVGMESQVLDDSGSDYKKLHPYQYHGSIYGVVPAKRGHQKPVGEWNVQEVTVKGKQVKVVLNGETIVDADIEKASTPKTIDGNKHPGLEREKGYICFCGHGAKVAFRNIKIKELK